MKKFTTDGLNKLSKELFDAVVEMGFNNDIPTRVALIHSEMSESFEAYRKEQFCQLHGTDKLLISDEQEDKVFKEHFEDNIKDTFEDELADTVIRLFDLIGFLDIDIEYHIKEKMRYNALRGHKFGKKF